MSLSELVEVLHIQPSKSQCLGRLMRLLVHSGFFSQIHGENEQQLKYSLTPSSRFLLHHDTTLETLPFLFLVLHKAMMAPCETMSSWLCSADDQCSTAFEMANGKSIWDYIAEEPDFGNLFHQTMEYDSQLIRRLVTRGCPEVFEGLKSMVDVGGGAGIMAKAIMEAFPHITCTAFDLQQMVSNHQKISKDHLNFIEGDIFEAKIPPTDAILLQVYMFLVYNFLRLVKVIYRILRDFGNQSVLHKWNDEESVRILKNCKDAIRGAKGGKVIIIEAVLENLMEDKESTETQLCGDVLMMASFTGRKRNEREWKSLFVAAGFSDYKITSFLGLRSLIEVYP